MSILDEILGQEEKFHDDTRTWPPERLERFKKRVLEWHGWAKDSAGDWFNRTDPEDKLSADKLAKMSTRSLKYFLGY